MARKTANARRVTARPAPTLPPSFRAHADDWGRRVCAMLCDFLNGCGIEFSPEAPLQLDPQVSLDAAAVLLQLDVLRRYGDAGSRSLEDANWILFDVFSTASESLRDGTEYRTPIPGFAEDTFRWVGEGLVWEAPGLVGADILLDPGADDALLADALADFLIAGLGGAEVGSDAEGVS